MVVDVFVHRIDGRNSIAASPLEPFCGEGIHFLDEGKRAEELIKRKSLAALFLSHIIDVLYASGASVGDQPIHISIQLLLLPYLKSTSLYQRLGASMVNSPRRQPVIFH